MSTKKQRKEKKKEEDKTEEINYKVQCPTIDELSDYVSGKLKDDKEKSLAIERHAFGEGKEGKSKSKGCKDCFKHIASLNGASETLVNAID